MTPSSAQLSASPAEQRRPQSTATRPPLQLPLATTGAAVGGAFARAVASCGAAWLAHPPARSAMARPARTERFCLVSMVPSRDCVGRGHPGRALPAGVTFNRNSSMGEFAMGDDHYRRRRGEGAARCTPPAPRREHSEAGGSGAIPCFAPSRPGGRRQVSLLGRDGRQQVPDTAMARKDRRCSWRRCRRPSLAADHVDTVRVPTTAPAGFRDKVAPTPGGTPRDGDSACARRARRVVAADVCVPGAPALPAMMGAAAAPFEARLR
jgi:hypothetical protein